MSTALSLPKGFGPPSKLFGSTAASNDELGSGVSSGYGIIGYKGKVWSTRYQGKDTPLMRDDGDGPRGSVEVVIVKGSAAISKIFYKNGYVEGSNAAPDCWSANGVTPDAGAQHKQNPTCAGCPMNAWGSRVTDSGKPGKACSDSRRLAVVPVNDIANEMLGGPMLLRVPAASLKDLKAYGELLQSYGYPPYGVATRISFDPKEAFPKFVFGAMRPLTDEEAKQVMAVREDKRTANVLNEVQEFKAPAQDEEAQEEVPSSPFEVDQAPATSARTAPAKSSAPAAKATAPKQTASAAPAAAKPAAKAAPKVEPEEEITQDEEEQGGTAPVSFDQMLEDIL